MSTGRPPLEARSVERAPARRMTPTLMLLSTVAGWGLYDDQGRTEFEAAGADARRHCLERAIELGVVRLRAGEQPHCPGARR